MLKLFDILTGHKRSGFGSRELQGCPLWEQAVNCLVHVPDSLEMAGNNPFCTKIWTNENSTWCLYKNIYKRGRGHRKKGVCTKVHTYGDMEGGMRENMGNTERERVRRKVKTHSEKQRKFKLGRSEETWRHRRPLGRGEERCFSNFVLFFRNVCISNWKFMLTVNKWNSPELRLLPTKCTFFSSSIWSYVYIQCY